MDEQQLPFPHAVQEQPETFLYRRDGQPAAQPLQDDPLVSYTVLGSAEGHRVYVSTAFLGVDASLGFSQHPLLWESVVIGGPMHGLQQRYTTEEDAWHGHRALLSEVDDALLEHGWDTVLPAAEEPAQPAAPELDERQAPEPRTGPHQLIVPTGSVDLDAVAAGIRDEAALR